MTPHEFVEKWKTPGIEKSSAQPHFVDLCRLLDEPDPQAADPKHEWFCFEKGATKAGGGDGWADVWRRGHFGWEYKSKGRNLDEAHRQLLNYSPALENPPLLIVSDFERFRVHTHWTNRVSKVIEFRHEKLLDATTRQVLKDAFRDPERLRPGKTRQQLTEEAAGKFAGLAKRLRERGHEAERVAHFVNRLVFCMFAEDVELLPKDYFTKMLRHAATDAEAFEGYCRTLFGTMHKGGLIGFEKIEWFNGGLFDSDDALPLEKADIAEVLEAARLDWADIDPSLMGTLFERGLDPDKRSQLGAHYTDRDKIMLIVNPVIVEPLTKEWEAAKAEMTVLVADAQKAREAVAGTTRRRSAAVAGGLFEDDDLVEHRRDDGRSLRRRTARADAERRMAQAREVHRAFVERLRQFRVLDPACGSGNFLYLALKALKDLEHLANVEAAAILHEVPLTPSVGPECVRGIEINPYAAELARVSVWIGEIQWMRAHGFDASRNPILKPLDTIECRDALLNADGTRAEWPEVDVVVGNPPFLGGKLLRTELGDETVDQMFSAYRGMVRPESDLVVYWFAIVGEQLQAGRLARAGLVATNSIRGGANRATVRAAIGECPIYSAWDDEPWVQDGAAVRVSLVCMSAEATEEVRFDGEVVEEIFADLTARAVGATSVNLTQATRQPQNLGIAFMGDTKGGAFDIPGELGREWLKLPANPNGRSNADVLRPWRNGMDITRRAADKWIIDFGWKMSEAEAALYEAPFAHIEEVVRPVRAGNKRESYARLWWRHVEPRPAMWERLRPLTRFIVTPTVAKHRLFTWLQPSVCADHQLIAIAREDDTTFGILHSRFHELWSLRMGTWLGKGNDPRYTPSTTFETFPFPDGLTPNIPAAESANDPRAQKIAAAAARLNELRENWLNPEDLVTRVPEVVPGYPDRILPVSEHAAKELKKRTLTNLYNARPAWLDNAHKTLDEAVAGAYGWGDEWRTGTSDDDILTRLFALNQERAGVREGLDGE